MKATGNVLRLTRTVAVLVVGLGALYIALSVPRGGDAGAARLKVMSSHGTLSQSNSRDGAAVLTASNLRPGASATGTVTIRNTGTLAGWLTLSDSALVDSPPGGDLSSKLELTIREVTSPQSPWLVYSGALKGMGFRSLGTLGAGNSRTYEFSVTFPASAPSSDNLYQAASVSVQYNWALEDPSGPGQAPTPAPPAPGPLHNAEPDSDIAKIRKRIKRRRLRAFSGKARDDVKVKRVEIALLRIDRKPRAARKRRARSCLWLRSSRAKFKLTRERSRTCSKRRWLLARGSSKWRLKLRKRLPKGRYILYSRATDFGGLSERSFSRGDRNMVKFTVR